MAKQRLARRVMPRVMPRPFGKAAARASARGRQSSGIAGRWQRNRSRGITRSIRFTELLWAGAAGVGGASTTYLPAPAAVAPAATLAAF